MLGKAGDIFSILPIVQASDHKNIIVSKQYASVLDGVETVNTHVFDGEWQDLAGAIKWAKKQFSRVIPLQVYGKTFPVQHKCRSFQIEQYHRAGRLDDWDKLELDLPRNLSVSYKSAKPFILFADESESAPFNFRTELFNALVVRFGERFNIVRASELKYPNIKDLLTVYDAAKLIISVDTAHLHLSAASKTPVIALAKDTPQLWHGTAWSKRFVFYCRYSAVLDRLDDLLAAADSVLNGTERTRLEVFPTRYKHGYNMGIILHNGRLLAFYRHHPEKGKWRTELVVQDGDTTLPVVVPKEHEGHSIEDPKPFMFRGKLHLCYVVSNYPQNPANCVIAYGELVQETDCWRIANQIIPKFSNNNFTGTQKNWCMFEADSALYAIYTSKPKQTVLQLDGSRVVSEFVSDVPTWNYGEIRGGVVLPYRGKLLRFFHSLTGERYNPDKFCYHVGALVMQKSAPFTIGKVTHKPIISGDEMWLPHCLHYKPNVVFPCGTIQKGNEFIISIGRNDCQSALVHVKESDLNL